MARAWRQSRRPAGARRIRAARPALLAAACAAAASGLRVGEAPGGFSCIGSALDDASASFEFRVDAHRRDGEVRHVALHYALSRHGSPWERLASQYEGPVSEEGLLATLQYMAERCHGDHSARDFVTQMVYDFVAQLVFAFATEDDTCVADVGEDALSWTLGFRCVEWGLGWEAQIRMGDVHGFQDRYFSLPSQVDCGSATAEWRCDMPRARQALLGAWTKMLSFRPERDRHMLLESARTFLGCPSLSFTDCYPPADVRRRVTARISYAPPACSDVTAQSSAGDPDAEFSMYAMSPDATGEASGGASAHSRAAPDALDDGGRHHWVLGVLSRIAEWLRSWASRGVRRGELSRRVDDAGHGARRASPHGAAQDWRSSRREAEDGAGSWSGRGSAHPRASPNASDDGQGGRHQWVLGVLRRMAEWLRPRASCGGGDGRRDELTRRADDAGHGAWRASPHDAAQDWRSSRREAEDGAGSWSGSASSAPGRAEQQEQMALDEESELEEEAEELRSAEGHGDGDLASHVASDGEASEADTIDSSLADRRSSRREGEDGTGSWGGRGSASSAPCRGEQHDQMALDEDSELEEEAEELRSAEGRGDGDSDIASHVASDGEASEADSIDSSLASWSLGGGGVVEDARSGQEDATTPLWHGFDFGHTPYTMQERFRRSNLLDAALLATLPTSYLRDSGVHHCDGSEGLVFSKARGPVARAALVQVAARSAQNRARSRRLRRASVLGGGPAP